jgi:hypothetical protein
VRFRCIFEDYSESRLPIATPNGGKFRFSGGNAVLHSLLCRILQQSRVLNLSSGRIDNNLSGVRGAFSYDQRDVVVLLVGAEVLYFVGHPREEAMSGKVAVRV